MNPLRLEVNEITGLLDRLDARDKSGGGPADASQAFSYRKNAQVRMRVAGPITNAAVVLPTRTISPTHLAFLYGGYVHCNVACDVQLVTTFGSWIDVTGVVEQCEHVDKSIHEVRFRFSQPIYPPMLTREACVIRALVVDDCPLILKLSKALLESLRVTVNTVSDGTEAVQSALSTKYDLILMDIRMPKSDGFAAMRSIRDAGYVGLIVAVSGQTDDQSRAKCLEAGCNQFLAKPFCRDDFAKLLNSIIDEPLYSTFSSDPALNGVVNDFVTELGKRGIALEKALLTSDKESISETIEWLRVNSASFGFQCITDLAARIQPPAGDEQIPAFRQEDALRLVRLCLQARAVPSGAPGLATVGA